MSKPSSIISRIAWALLMSMLAVQSIHAQQTQDRQSKEQTQKQLIQEVEARELALKTQMDLIRKTNSLSERQQLLDGHLKIMLEQVKEVSTLSGMAVDPVAGQTMMEQRTQLIMSLLDQVIAHYQMQLTCTK
jgi:hypothetical protein